MNAQVFAENVILEANGGVLNTGGRLLVTDIYAHLPVALDAAWATAIQLHSRLNYQNKTSGTMPDGPAPSYTGKTTKSGQIAKYTLPGKLVSGIGFAIKSVAYRGENVVVYPSKASFEAVKQAVGAGAYLNGVDLMIDDGSGVADCEITITAHLIPDCIAEDTDILVPTSVLSETHRLCYIHAKRMLNNDNIVRGGNSG